MKKLLTLSSILLISNFANAQRVSTDLIKAASIDSLYSKPTNSSPVQRGTSITYNVTNNQTDPNCVTPFGGYVDLEGFGILTQSAINGDEIGFNAFGTGLPIRFYGNDFTGLGFTDNGTVQFGGVINTDNVNVGIPNIANPNNMVAIFQNNMQVVYDQVLNHGVSLATSGAEIIIIEYDDLQPSGGGASIGDFQIIINRSVVNQPNTPEFVVAFDNIGTLPASVTIGTEDSTGMEGTQFLFGDPATPIVNGLIVCFDTQGDVPVELMNYSVD